MKYIYALLFLSISVISTAQTWQRKNVVKGATCSDIIKLNSGKTIALSTDGVYGSADLAENWSKISSDMDADLSNYINDVEPEALYLSNDTIYAYFRSKLFVSTNEGINWQQVNTGSVRPAYETTFAIKNSNLFLTKFDFNTNLSTIYISTNAGASWTVSDTISANIKLFGHNNEVYLWGYTGSLWTVKNICLKKLDANNKITSMPSAGLPANTDIRGMGAAGNNLILLIPEYNQSSTIIASKLYGFNGQTWVQGGSFTENYSKLYSVGEYCYQPFFNSAKVLRSRDGINWSTVNTTKLYGYYSSIRRVTANKILASSRAGVFELDSNFNRIEKSNGMFTPSLNGILEFKSKIYLNSSDNGLYVSTDNAVTFSAANITNERTGENIKTSSNKLYVYNAYLMPSDKIYVSADGTAWDTLVMPAGNFSQRQVLMVSDNGVWMTFTESNVKSYKFYNDQNNAWSDVSSVVPSNASYFNTYRGTNGNMVVFNTYYENNVKKTNVYQLENNASTWKLLKHTMGDLWYENTSVHNNTFYILKNAYNKVDSLFKISNDSVVFEKTIKYGSYKFYTDNFYESFFYRGNDIYCLGFDSTQQNTINIIRSTDGGLTWEVFNKGLSSGTQVKSILFGTTLLASTTKGLYEFGSTSSFVNNTKQEFFNVFPNPTTGILSINASGISKAEVSVYTINGALVYKENLDSPVYELNLSAFEKGLYILKIKSEKGIETKKVVLQ